MGDEPEEGCCEEDWMGHPGSGKRADAAVLQRRRARCTEPPTSGRPHLCMGLPRAGLQPAAALTMTVTDGRPSSTNFKLPTRVRQPRGGAATAARGAEAGPSPLATRRLCTQLSVAAVVGRGVVSVGLGQLAAAEEEGTTVGLGCDWVAIGQGEGKGLTAGRGAAGLHDPAAPAGCGTRAYLERLRHQVRQCGWGPLCLASGGVHTGLRWSSHPGAHEWWLAAEGR